MNFTEYQQLAELLNKARGLLYSEATLGPKNKSKYRHYVKSIQYIDKLRAECEELMFIDCPTEATIYILYPGQTEALNQ